MEGKVELVRGWRGGERVCGGRRYDGPSFPFRSPSNMFSIQVRCLSTDEGFERPLQDYGPIEVPFIVRNLVYPLAVFVYGTRDGTRDPLTLDEPRSKIWPMSNCIEGLPPGSSYQPTGSEQENGQFTRSYGSGTRKTP